MKKYIKAFKTINNGTGGVFGLKTIKGTKGMSHTMANLEDCKKITIVSYSSTSTSIVKNAQSRVILKKKNTNTFLSKKQFNYYSTSKKNLIYLYRKKKVFLGTEFNMGGARVFCKNK